MMHRAKRGISCILVFMLLVGLMPSAAARQFQVYQVSSSSQDEISAMLDAIDNQTFPDSTSAATVRGYVEHLLYNSSFAALDGNRFPATNSQGYWAGKTLSDGTYTKTVSATGCYAYCKFAALITYGTHGERHNHWESAGRMTGQGLKDFLGSYAQAGEHIRIDSKHSVTFISATADGFYYTDYTGDANPYIRLRYTTYENFAAKCNELYMRIWIYDANPLQNTGKQATVQEEAQQEEAAAEVEAVSVSDWFYDSAMTAQELGLMTGATDSDATYNDPITLAETVTLAARVHSVSTVGGLEFAPVTGGAWYQPYVDYLTENGVLTETYEYSKAATREEFIHIMAQALPKEGNREIAPTVLFDDDDVIRYGSDVDYLCRLGVITGVTTAEGTFFYPHSTITRGEAVTIVTRMAEPTLRVAG